MTGLCGGERCRCCFSLCEIPPAGQGTQVKSSRMSWRDVPACHHGQLPLPPTCTQHFGASLTAPSHLLSRLGINSWPIPLILSTPGVCCLFLQGRPGGEAATHCCRLSPHLFQFPVTREGPQQTQNSRCDRPTSALQHRGVPAPLQRESPGTRPCPGGPWSSLSAESSSGARAVCAGPAGEVPGPHPGGLGARRWRSAVRPRAPRLEWCPCLEERQRGLEWHSTAHPGPAEQREPGWRWLRQSPVSLATAALSRLHGAGLGGRRGAAGWMSPRGARVGFQRSALSGAER